MYITSDDQGQSWSENTLICDPDDPPDGNLNENQHLGTLRHSILVQDDGRWMLPLTVAGNRSLGRGELNYPGVQLYDPVRPTCFRLAPSPQPHQPRRSAFLRGTHT